MNTLVRACSSCLAILRQVRRGEPVGGRTRRLWEAFGRRGRFALALMLVATFSPAAHAQYWSYGQMNGSWSDVKSYSEQQVNAYWATQNITANCVWTGSEPQPQVSTTGPWGGTWQGTDGVSHPCTGSYAVTWNACPVDTRFVEQDHVCAPVKNILQGNKPPKCGDKFGNPIYPLLGSKQEPLDTQIRLGPETLRLTYDSSRELVGEADGGTAKSFIDLPSFGALWLSNLHRRLIISPNQVIIQAYRGDGRLVSFQVSGSSITADADVDDRLVSVSGGYRYVDARARTIETYDGSGRLLSIAYAGGQSLTFTYSDSSTAATVAPAAGYLIAVSDSFGRSLHFSYTLPTGGVAATDGRISQITDASGQTTLVGYDASGNLLKITWADNAVRQFVYDLSGTPWALTGVIDERQVRFSTFGYDANGRAVSTEHAGGVDRYSVRYDTPPQAAVTEVYDSVAKTIYRYHTWQPPINPVLTDPSGSAVGLGSATVFGYPHVSTRSQAAGAGCSASTSSTAYDANGNVAVLDDFNGTRACYLDDQSRNLETVRVEGLANGTSCSSVTATNVALPAGSRKISSVWHPDWPLRSQQAEPGKLTTWIYNGQADPYNGNAVASCAPAGATLPDGKPIAVLCKQVELATTDSTGASGLNAALQTGVAARVWQWTYNALGQVMTVTDPLNNATSYAYFADSTSDHTAGDLQSITNAAGHVVQFAKYDAAGRLLRWLDANGAAVDTLYTARGWVNSTTVTPAGGGAGLTTAYNYDPSGLLISTQNPDGSTLTYTHDDARRLIGVADSAGNTIAYTLDNAGNRVSEQVKDAGGVLARNISRSYDALNRLQSVTGATR